jgi:hypothetical protein
MSHEALLHINTYPIELPSSKVIGAHGVWRVFSNLASHASNDKGLVWVSDRTQEKETGIHRRNIREARILFEQQGILVDTCSRKQKGVKVFQLVIPGFQFASGLAITPTEQQVSGQVSGLASGQVSGLASGQVSGLAITPQTEQNLNKTYIDKTHFNFDPITALFDFVVDQQLVFENWRTHTTKEKHKAKVQAQFLPVCAIASRQYPGGHNDPLVASWVLSELFAKENPNYKMSPSAFMALTDKYRLPGSCVHPVNADLPATSEQTVNYAKAAREIFTKAQQENRQRKLNN